MKKAIFSLLLFVLYNCALDKQQTFNPDKLSGKELSEIYCNSCHLYSKPDFLPKNVWKEVLPQMGNYLGIISEKYNPYKNLSMEEGFLLKAAKVFPSEPQLSEENWQKIVDFYNGIAPDKLEEIPISRWNTSSLFASKIINVKKISQPNVTAVNIDRTEQKIYIGTKNGLLILLEKDLQTIRTTYLRNPVIQTISNPSTDQLLVGCIGIMNPSNLKRGGIIELNPENLSIKNILVKDIPRLVHFSYVDMNEDGLNDLLSCGFGHQIGSFSYYEKKGTQYELHVLKNMAGALKTYPIDFDQDGDLDILTLFGQGREGISLFVNENGQFQERRLLNFPSVQGSSDFDFIDFDQDGDLDIIYANGDNGDYSYTLKPYHGVRIFLNQGNFEFTEHYFFPMHGASKVKANDYDQDGDIDLFAISFYPDFQKVKQSLVYLEQQDNGQFKVCSIPNADMGRWMTMDSGDFDGDGDTDIVLGSFVLEEKMIPKYLLSKWWQSNVGVMILENTLKNDSIQ